MAKCRARLAMLYKLKIKSEKVRKYLATSLVRNRALNSLKINCHNEERKYLMPSIGHKKQ